MSASNMRPTHTNRQTQKAEATRSNSSEGRSSQGSMDQVLDLRKSSSPGKPCIWCGKHSTFCSATDNGIGAEFCSEVCFDQFRRDSFKKRSACFWCNNSSANNGSSGSGAHVNINLNSNLDETKFCSETCLAQFKVRLFCEETSAHLDQIKNSKNGVENVGHGPPNSNQHGTDLITPDLWLKKLPNGFLGGGGVERTSPNSSSSSDLSPSTLFSPNYALSSCNNDASCSVPSVSPASTSTSGRRLLGDGALSPKAKGELSPCGRVNCKPRDPNFSVINDPFSHSNYLSSVKRSRVHSSPSAPARKRVNPSFPTASNFMNQNSIPVLSHSPLIQPIQAAAPAHKTRPGKRNRSYKISACNVITTMVPTTPSVPVEIPLIIHPSEMTFVKSEAFVHSDSGLGAPTSELASRAAKFKDSLQSVDKIVPSTPTSAQSQDISVSSSVQTDESRINVSKPALLSSIPSGHPIFEALLPRAVVFLPYPVPLPIPMPLPLNFQKNSSSLSNSTCTLSLDPVEREGMGGCTHDDGRAKAKEGKSGRVLVLDLLDDVE